jgi:hypothetical protein
MKWKWKWKWMHFAQEHLEPPAEPLWDIGGKRPSHDAADRRSETSMTSCEPWWECVRTLAVLSGNAKERTGRVCESDSIPASVVRLLVR